MSSKNKNNSIEQIAQELTRRYGHREDPWGLKIEKTINDLKLILPIYEEYFKVRVFGTNHVKDEPYLVIANHTGQIAIDGSLLCTAFVRELHPPRLLRPMVERFFTKIPFVGSWAAAGGAVLGDRQNCLLLLERGESVLVFPEGVKGIAKSTPEYYHLQPFTYGFFRMALDASVKILPVGIVGAEEMFPFVYQARSLAKWLNLPALPLTPIPFPLPSPIDIHIGEPFEIPQGLDRHSTDKDIADHVLKLESITDKLVKEGLKQRREFIFNKEAP